MRQKCSSLSFEKAKLALCHNIHSGVSMELRDSLLNQSHCESIMWSLVSGNYLSFEASLTNTKDSFACCAAVDRSQQRAARLESFVYGLFFWIYTEFMVSWLVKSAFRWQIQIWIMCPLNSASVSVLKISNTDWNRKCYRVHFPVISEL